MIKFLQLKALLRLVYHIHWSRSCSDRMFLNSISHVGRRQNIITLGTVRSDGRFKRTESPVTYILPALRFRKVIGFHCNANSLSNVTNRRNQEVAVIATRLIRSKKETPFSPGCFIFTCVRRSSIIDATANQSWVHWSKNWAWEITWSSPVERSRDITLLMC